MKSWSIAFGRPCQTVSLIEANVGRKTVQKVWIGSVFCGTVSEKQNNSILNRAAPWSGFISEEFAVETDAFDRPYLSRYPRAPRIGYRVFASTRSNKKLSLFSSEKANKARACRSLPSCY